MSNLYVTFLNKKYHFHSPPILQHKHRDIGYQKNSNNSFDVVSKTSFYFPCKKKNFKKQVENEVKENPYDEITDRKIVSHFLPTDMEETQLSPYFPQYINRVQTFHKATQTQTCEVNPVNYVYDYYIEVIPVLERLVGYTIELAMTEIISEEEVILRKAANQRFNEIVAPERVEVNRRREETYRRNEEIRRRVVEVKQKEWAYRKEEAIMYRKIVHDFLEEYIGIKEDMVENRQEEELDATSKTIQRDLVKHFINDVLKSASKVDGLTLEYPARACVDNIIREACNKRNWNF